MQSNTPPKSQSEALEQRQPSSTDRASRWFADNFSSLMAWSRQKIEAELRLKQIIENAHAIEVNSQVHEDFKLGIRPSIYLSAFVLVNLTLIGMYRISQPAHRNLRSVFKFCLGSLYALLSINLYLQDEYFLSKLQTTQFKDIDLSDSRYIYRKQCLEKASELTKVKKRIQKYQMLNKRYEEFHKI